MKLIEILDAVVPWVWLGGAVASIATFGFCVWLVHPNSKANREEAARREREKEEADRAFLESSFIPEEETDDPTPQ